MPRAKLYVLDGRVINVGEWDLCTEAVVIEVRRETGHMVAVVADPDHPERTELIPEFETIQLPTGDFVDRNPVPEGAEIIEDGEYVWTEKERIVLPTDYYRLRQDAYPPVTEGLDAIVKGGPELEAYRTKCQAVKTRFPKPATR